MVFGDKRDLGYGRRMTARQNADGTLAFMVENYLVEAGTGYTYSTLNLDAAVTRDTRHLIGVNGIEFSPGPDGGTSFAKFFNFNPATGERQAAVDLDGRGDKSMPGPCITCHGGRGDALTPPDASGKPRFNLVQNSVSGERGDVQARLHPFEVDAFDFSSAPGFTRAEQEATLKTLNRWVLCSYPLPAPSTFPEDACRRPASANEWQGTAAALIKSYYGGDGLPGATFTDTYVPASWQAAGQTTLYQQVIAPACRACHVMRGTGAQSDIDFTTWEKFRPYADRIKAHVLERGNMPLAKIVYDAFWSSTAPATLATFLEGEGYSVRDANGAVADARPARRGPGPEPGRGPRAPRRCRPRGACTRRLRLVDRLGPAGRLPRRRNTAQPTFTAPTNGTYVVQLVASNGSTQSAPAQLTIVVEQRACARSPRRSASPTSRPSIQAGNPARTATARRASSRGRRSSTPTRTATATASRATRPTTPGSTRRCAGASTSPTSPRARCCASPPATTTAAAAWPGSTRRRRPGDPARAKYDLFLELDPGRRPAVSRGRPPAPEALSSCAAVPCSRSSGRRTAACARPAPRSA